MSLLHAFFFGLLQGITEFLPISSSAHLKLAKLFFDIPPSESQVLFDLVCHLGTLIAILLFFKDDIVSLLFRDRKKLAHLFLATLPLIPCYFLLKPLREAASGVQYLGPCLLFTALLLFAGEKIRFASTTQRPYRDLFWIGTLQSIALIPGISRSASTISCARALGWHMPDAVRFSFLLSVPTILGGNLLEGMKLFSTPLPPLSLPACTVGFLTSFLVGWVVIRFAIAFLEKGNLKPFAWYCAGLGLTLTLLLRGT